MWCYQKPGFEALLLAGLQQQQQSSQFCDTLLRTEGVSVPVHSSILSAISPRISSELSSMPPPPPGQSHLVDFRALSARTLLRMVGLFYSGEMAGEGEEEKREAVSAAAKLGIHGLVEVARRDQKSRHGKEKGHCAEVGVQTEPVESEGSQKTWDVRDGVTILSEETPSHGEKASRTQTEGLLGNAAPSDPAVSYETIDVAALQSLIQPDPSFSSPQIPYAPVSYIYPPEGNQAHQPLSAAMDCLQGSTTAGQMPVAVVAQPYTSFSSSSIPSGSCQTNPCTQTWWAGSGEPHRDVAAGGELEDERLNQFLGDIPGYIDYFFKPDSGGDSRGGRETGRRARGAANVRRAGTGERKPGRPRGRAGQRGRGGLTQKMTVQEVGVSTLQKLFLQRSRRRFSRTGQGGGAAGRSLWLQSRELLKPARSRRRTVLETFPEVKPSRDAPSKSRGGAGRSRRGRENTAPPQAKRPVGRPRKTKAEPSPMQSHKDATVRPSSSRPSPSTNLLTPAASSVSPASRLLRTSSLCPSVPPPQQEHLDTISELLEEVIMTFGNSNSNSGPHLPAASRSSGGGGGSSVAANGRGADGSGCTNGEVLDLQEQSEAELNEMLEDLLLSFEQHVNSSAAGKEAEPGRQSSAAAAVTSSQPPERQQPEREKGPSAGKRKRNCSNCVPPFERKKESKPTSWSEKASKAHELGDKQLQQVAVVKLERSRVLPGRVTLQELGSQTLDAKNVAKTKCSSSKKNQQDDISCKNQNALLKTKTLRTRLRSLHTDSMQVVEEPLLHNQPPPAGPTGNKRTRSKKNRQRPNKSADQSLTPAGQRPVVEPRGAEKPPQVREEKRDPEVAVPPQDREDVPPLRGGRGAGTGEESDDGFVSKKVCLAPTPRRPSEGNAAQSGSAETEPAGGRTEHVVQEKTVPPRQEQGGDPVCGAATPRDIERCSTGEEKISGDGKTDVDGDREEKYDRERGTSPSPSEVGLGSAGLDGEEDKCDDVDVIGGSSPPPDPVTITWTSPEDSDEGKDIDVDN